MSRDQGLAQCPQLRPNQGWDPREAPRVGTRLMWSGGRASSLPWHPILSSTGRPGAWAQILLSLGGGLSSPGLCLLV